jgi:hypothetical protein
MGAMKKGYIISFPLNARSQSSALLILALAAFMGAAYASSTGMDIDYSHNVVGTGTVITDFKMGSDESTVASGKVRGTGEVMNKYIFSSNNSDNVSIEDEFHFAQSPLVREISLRDYPLMTRSPGSFRLLGAAWAGKINLSLQNESDWKGSSNLSSGS